MNIFYIIIFVVFMPFVLVALFAGFCYLFFTKEQKEDVKRKTAEDMRKEYPNWPYVERPKIKFASFPLNLWNDPD